MQGDRIIKKSHVALAYALAVFVDLIQIPGNLLMLGGFLSGIGILPVDVTGETLDMAVDAVTACVMTGLIGFHWTLLPTFVLEMVPLADAAPTWTACVAYVVYRRKKEGRIESAEPVRIIGRGVDAQVLAPKSNARYCTSCGTTAAQGMRFCAGCGRALG